MIDADTVQKFAAQAQALRAEMHEGGRYEYIKDRDKERVEDGLRHMDVLLQKGALNPDDKVKLFDLQEEVNGALTRSDRDYLVCKREPRIGSRIADTTCHAVGEIERRCQRDMTALRELQTADSKQTPGPSGH